MYKLSQTLALKCKISDQIEQLAAEHTWRKIFFTDKLRLQMLMSRQRTQMKLQSNDNEIQNKQVYFKEDAALNFTIQIGIFISPHLSIFNRFLSVFLMKFLA